MIWTGYFEGPKCREPYVGYVNSLYSAKVAWERDRISRVLKRTIEWKV